jgi:hypothetical protein
LQQEKNLHQPKRGILAQTPTQMAPNSYDILQRIIYAAKSAECAGNGILYEFQDGLNDNKTSGDVEHGADCAKEEVCHEAAASAVANRTILPEHGEQFEDDCFDYTISMKYDSDAEIRCVEEKLVQKWTGLGYV